MMIIKNNSNSKLQQVVNETTSAVSGGGDQKLKDEIVDDEETGVDESQPNGECDESTAGEFDEDDEEAPVTLRETKSCVGSQSIG